MAFKLDGNFCSYLMTLPVDQWNEDCCNILWDAVMKRPSSCPQPTYNQIIKRKIDIGEVNVTGGSTQLISSDPLADIHIGNLSTTSGTSCTGNCGTHGTFGLILLL